MRELVGSKNTIGQMASVLKKLQKATSTFTFICIIQDLLKSDKKNGHFTLISIYILDHILLDSS